MDRETMLRERLKFNMESIRVKNLKIEEIKEEIKDLSDECAILIEEINRLNDERMKKR